MARMKTQWELDLATEKIARGKESSRLEDIREELRQEEEATR